jgi:hypothetical protein
VHKYPEVTVSTVANASSPTDSINIILPSPDRRIFARIIPGSQPFYYSNSGIRADYFDINKQTKIFSRVNLLYCGPIRINFRAGGGVFINLLLYSMSFMESSVDNTGYQKQRTISSDWIKNISNI